VLQPGLLIHHAISMSSDLTLCPKLYFIVYLSCKRKKSARPFCYGTDSESVWAEFKIVDGNSVRFFAKPFPTRQTVFRTPLVPGAAAIRRRRRR
jgi:hypothetical protein